MKLLYTQDIISERLRKIKTNNISYLDFLSFLYATVNKNMQLTLRYFVDKKKEGYIPFRETFFSILNKIREKNNKQKIIQIANQYLINSNQQNNVIKSIQSLTLDNIYITNDEFTDIKNFIDSFTAHKLTKQRRITKGFGEIDSKTIKIFLQFEKTSLKIAKIINYFMQIFLIKFYRKDNLLNIDFNKYFNIIDIIFNK